MRVLRTFIYRLLNWLNRKKIVEHVFPMVIDKYPKSLVDIAWDKNKECF
jgi:hypothetical protein